MTPTRSLTLILLTICSSGALAMGGPVTVYVDTTCQRMIATHASQELKAFFKHQCPDGAQSPAAHCKDLDHFLRDVASNNLNIKNACGQ